MHMVIYYDGDEYKTCGFIGPLPAAPFTGGQFGLPDECDIIAVVENFTKEQTIHIDNHQFSLR